MPLERASCRCSPPIGPISLSDWRGDDGSALTDADLAAIADDVQSAAYRVIAGKGATNYAIGLSGARIVEAVLRDVGAILPVSSVLDDYQGVTGVALSVPSIVDGRGVSRVLDVGFSDEERAKLHASADAIEGSLKALGF